ncbi:MAG TPA: malto-oligosyltrehalose synthase, partial [Cellulomonadaceae bacterium]|nr:malto-oligosyltrehalose synthase [Cellulomonadaceae bacterium]
KREVVDGALYAEVYRLTELAATICHEDLRLRDHTWRSLHDCLVELLVAFDRYRAYVVPGAPVHPDSVDALETAARIARERLSPERGETMDVLVDLLLGREAGSAGRTRGARRDELVVRFQQTCGAVMAKGVEDTAFYRWTQLVGLCEVGGEPARFALTPTELASWAARTQAQAPLGLTTLSTHDTKRSSDTRARLGVLSEVPTEWSRLVDRLRTASAAYRSALLDGRTENLLWQTLAGTWSPDGPIDGERIAAYLVKATREAGSRTTWTAPDTAYEAAVLDVARRALADPAVVALLTAWEQRTRDAVRAATLGTSLVQLTLPGVADVYQGTEVTSIALVDPDNRRPVHTDAIAARLARLDDGAGPRDLADEKLVVTSRALRTRRDLREAFVGADAGFIALAHSSGHAITYARTVAGEARVVVVATRLAIALDRLGGWGEHTVALPEGEWHDVLTDRAVLGGVQPVGPLLERLPVALLVRATS